MSDPIITDIYEAAVEAGVEIDHHASDLYLPMNATTNKLVACYHMRSNVTTFTSQIDGKPWYDIPFAYTPFWEAKNK